MFSLDDLRAAQRTVYAAMPPTPQYWWPLLAERAGAEVLVKHENHTPIGAFKVRGGLVYFDALARAGRLPKGVVTATRGNHGQSVALAATRHGVPAVIVAPEGNSVEKNAAMRGFGAELVLSGVDFDESRLTAGEIAEERGYDFVPSFHRELVRGVATYALELFEAADDLDALYAPIGMGSGICGLITTRDLLGLKTEIIGVVAEQAPAFAHSIERGAITPSNSAATFADGMACRDPGEEPLEIVRRGAARVITLSEAEIAEAIRIYYSDTHNLAEGAGAAPLAGLLKERERMRGKRVGLVLSGGNIDAAWFAEVLKGGAPTPT